MSSPYGCKILANVRRQMTVRTRSPWRHTGRRVDDAEADRDHWSRAIVTITPNPIPRSEQMQAGTPIATVNVTMSERLAIHRHTHVDI